MPCSYIETHKRQYLSTLHTWNLPLPAANSKGGSPQWSGSFRGAPYIDRFIYYRLIAWSLHHHYTNTCNRDNFTKQAAYEYQHQVPQLRYSTTYLHDMLLHPVIVSIHTVSPNIGLFWDEFPILHGLEIKIIEYKRVLLYVVKYHGIETWTRPGFLIDVANSLNSPLHLTYNKIEWHCCLPQNRND